MPGGGGVAVLNRGVRRMFTEKVTFGCVQEEVEE